MTGTATPASTTFTLDGVPTEERPVALPWRKVFELPAGTGRHEWTLVVRFSGGTVSAVAISD